MASTLPTDFAPELLSLNLRLHMPIAKVPHTSQRPAGHSQGVSLHKAISLETENPCGTHGFLANFKRQVFSLSWVETK